VTTDVELSGGWGDDYLACFGSGRAVIYGGAGADIIYGGSGSDLVYRVYVWNFLHWAWKQQDYINSGERFVNRYA
jgi:Ca2+-binding RTX toxin-like protein